ncbi:hypothetical protein FNV43_RR20743 [Rhamnella rubrinervis]|uniref:Uncharacterized protein n=1 Tax=Rhamnella rubrinervis TaxID=2594499 RepID=A0A8K0DUZ0_9ROSA|nr:hypothetical protein FNV43_RR20743 [Rhamnella rubrinervis]
MEALHHRPWGKWAEVPSAKLKKVEAEEDLDVQQSELDYSQQAMSEAAEIQQSGWGLEPEEIDLEAAEIQQTGSGLEPEQIDLEAEIQQSVLEIKGSAKIIVCFCFASAIEIALVSAQLHSHLLPIFHFLSLSILLGFAALLISKLIKSMFPNAARVLEAASVFFVVTAFFIAISIPFPLYLKLAVLVVYAVCLIFVLRALYNHFYR